MMRRITQAVVTYEDGTTEVFVGKGGATITDTYTVVECPTPDRPHRTRDKPVKYVTITVPLPATHAVPA